MPTPRAGYFLADGTKVPGVTTMLNRWKDSGGLLQWAYQQGKSGAPTLYGERDKAGDIGTLAHAMVERYLKNHAPEEALDGVAPDMADKARTAYAAFQTWKDQTNAKIISIETPMVSESLRLGGTPDIAIMWGDQLMMADIKTSNAIYRDYLIQVALYRYIWNEVHPDDQMAEGCHILRFGKDHADFEHRFFTELNDALECGKLLRQAYDYDLLLKKRAA